ncbi:MAG: DUF4157 domain-containing protein [Candidatus Aminicenantes bacterium]|nr:DUF4157 domain-containing protein [Candidatus Aminicenantes bacterium]NIM83157.1 DUF4157 domain-containing protein [Candidatus Aminicenantes bacterium]NIN22533.1 DUF4157 domain-containing protein [Candidatus Aminicenantes bacterium]NIN46304.1 DUF4157 domain-containing protein [Candidatus Aminicenantes bacterium]NIN89143.1 DUF4157 domain-containing protein [Candidatus Aminicenantes bacterium]
MYEQEANRVADQVMRMPEPKQSLVNGHWSLGRKESEPVCPECIKEVNSPMIQRQVEEEEEEEEIIQTKPVSSSFEVNPDVESRIQSLTGSGQPLAQSTRNFFGPRFGVDFSHVRVHTDSRAAQTAQAINAQAYTTGNHIVFNRNQYAPGSIQGKYLLAHELTHVMQQNKDSRMIQSQENGGAATLAGLTARRTAFNNTGTTDADNCCAICPVNLGVGVAGGARNGMELEYTISGTIPAGTEFDITRTIRGADWQQDGGAWARINTIPAGTGDDHHNDDECLIPNRRRIFVEDRPGMPAMNPRGTGLNGVSVSATATAYVGKLNFFEWVIARNRRLGIGWTRISQPTFTTWHSITSVALVGGTWTRVNTPNGDANEIELGTVNTTGNTP